jgi:proline iminopeptidase
VLPRNEAVPPLLDSGRLALRDGASLYWETSGRTDGVPVLWLHGGPGSGLRGERYRRKFDADRNLVIGVDQRGCGRSLPLVTDDLSSLVGNTTDRLIADLEELRASLGLDRWIVTGGSWGSTLALAYAAEHPERVIGVVVGAVTTTSRDEVDWITEGVGRLFPEAWAAFEAASGRREGERVVEAYARRLADPADAADRARAADDWDAWESVHVSLDPAWRPGPMHDDPVDRAVSAHSSRTTGPTTGSCPATGQSWRAPIGWRTCRSCSSTAAATSAGRSSHHGGCISASRAASSTWPRTRGTAAPGRQSSCARRSPG